MKKLLILILILCLPVMVIAGGVMMLGGGTPVAGSGIYTNDADLICLYRFENNLNDTSANAQTLTVSAGDTLDYPADNKSVGSGDSKSVNFDQENAEWAFRTNADLISTFPGKSGGSTSWSVVFWMKAVSIPPAATYDHIIGKGDNAWWIRLAEELGNIQFAIYDTTWRIKTVATAISINTWYHIAMTMDDTGNLMIVYIDAVAKTPNTTVTTQAATTDSFYVAEYNGASPTFDGLLDEVAIFKRTLSQAEINEIYTNGIQDP